MNPGERQRFHNLLKLAAESPFEGERRNALLAAERMATRYGLSLDEAAAGQAPNPRRSESERAVRDAHAEEALWPEGGLSFTMSPDLGRTSHLMDHVLDLDRKRREAAMRQAMARGLDAEERADAERRERRPSRQPGGRNKQGMPSDRHARVLLQETSLSFGEIAKITGLDLYQIVGLKLKLRSAA